MKSYAASQNLTPAFGGILDGQIGNNAPPPSYQQAIVLQVRTGTCTVRLLFMQYLNVPDLYIKVMLYDIVLRNIYHRIAWSGVISFVSLLYTE